MDMKHDFRPDPELWQGRGGSVPPSGAWRPEAVAIAAILALFWIVLALRFLPDGLIW